jgi:peptide/nickel transport system permease protein
MSAVAEGPSNVRRPIRLPLVKIACILVLGFWASVALVGSWLAPHPIGDIVSVDAFGPISREFPLGTDYLGRDMLSRIIYGARYTLGVSLAATALACLTGVVLGMASAAIGGIFDAAVSRTLDALNAIPHLMFGLVIVAALGSSMPVLIGTLALLYFAGAYRLARSQAVTINTLDYVEVAKARGEGTLYIIRSEILPNIIGPVMADFGLRFVFVVLLLSGLSFLGLGVQPPQADWGTLVRENISGLSFGAVAVLMPSFAIASLTISVNLLIDSFSHASR